MLSFRVALSPVMLTGRLGLRAPRAPRRSDRRPPRQYQPCGCRASRGAAGAEWRSGRQGRWPLDASSRSPQTPGEEHWPLGCLISPNTPRHGPWPRPLAAKQKPSKTPGERPAKTPGNARETRKHWRFAPGVRQNARRPGVPGAGRSILGLVEVRRLGGATGRRDDGGALAAAADLRLATCC